MIFKNNNLTKDTDAEHLARAQMMAVGVATYGAALDFTPAQITEYDAYATDIYAALNTQHEESADVDEYFVLVKNTHDSAVAKYRACQLVIKGEMESATPGTVEYLDERFDIEDDIPRGRKGFLKVAEFMVSAYDAIGVEHPDVALPATAFEELRTLVAELLAAMEAIGRELAEQKEATVSKNVLRTTVGEKGMRKCFHRAVAYWGDDDPRLLELGLVPKSSIWTPGQPEPGEEPLIPWPGPAEFEAEHLGGGTVELRPKLIADMVDGTIERRKKPDYPWEMITSSITIEDGKVIPHRDLNAPMGMIVEYKFTPLNAGGEKGLETIVEVNVE